MARRRAKVSTVSGGSRPDFAAIVLDSKTFDRDFKGAMYYAHYELSDKKLKSETVKYAKKNKLDVKQVEAADNRHFVVVGKVCYILNNGGEVPQQYSDYLESQLKVILQCGEQALAEKVEEKEEKPKNVISIQDRLREQAGRAAEEFDLAIDEFVITSGKFKLDSIDPYGILVKHELKGGHARWVVKFYEKEKQEVQDVLDGDCPQLKEAYGKFTKPQLKKLLKFYDAIESAANMLIESSKVARKPRKKKAVSADKLVAKLKYRKEDKDLGLVSASPRDIIGASELWVYNTKTRKIGRYTAADQAGLSVKGTTIQNFSSDSVEKTLRKPAEQIKEFKGSGKVALRKFLDNIKTLDIKLKGRLNEHHILLKVSK
jgi:hypothetical protein